MGMIHVFNFLKMGFGVILLFVAVILWSIFKRYSSAMLALTALLLYAQIVLDLLDFYEIIHKETLLVYAGIPLLTYSIPLIVVVSFIITLLVFIKEERKS